MTNDGCRNPKEIRNPNGRQEKAKAQPLMNANSHESGTRESSNQNGQKEGGFDKVSDKVFDKVCDKVFDHRLDDGVRLFLSVTVAPISNRQALRHFKSCRQFPRAAGWKPCDTADWKSALR